MFGATVSDVKGSLNVAQAGLGDIADGDQANAQIYQLAGQLLAAAETVLGLLPPAPAPGPSPAARPNVAHAVPGVRK